MKIEEGKRYLNRRGDVVGPMMPHNSTKYPWFCASFASTYSANGALFIGEETAGDLIAEWQNGDGAKDVTPSPEPAGQILLDWSATASPEYAPLAAILQEAYDQAATGKGKERHANDRAFIDQPILEIGRMCGPGFNTGQSIKKQQEAMGMLARGHHASAIRELLGAINYAAAAVLLIREQNPGA